MNRTGRGRLLGCGLIVGLLGLVACAPLPPERVTRRAALDQAASDCRARFPIIERYQIDSFDRIVYYYREDVPWKDREEFLDCVRGRLQPSGQTVTIPATAPSGISPERLALAKQFFQTALTLLQDVLVQTIRENGDRFVRERGFKAEDAVRVRAVLQKVFDETMNDPQFHDGLAWPFATYLSVEELRALANVRSKDEVTGLVNQGTIDRAHLERAFKELDGFGERYTQSPRFQQRILEAFKAEFPGFGP